LERLADLNAQARTLFESGDTQQAALLVKEAQPLAQQLLAVSQPSLPAMEAVSDHDQIYADLLLSNRHYGHARQMYQRNVARWKHWRPQTPATRQRLADAEAAIARCDRAIRQQP
jgi:hypothetical protein